MNLAWFESTWLHEVMIGSAWLFPFFEIIHFMVLCFLMGALLVIDLRFLGLLRGFSLEKAEKFIPWAAFGFGINLITGIAFFFTDPFRYGPNRPFQIKMALIFLAGLNLVWYKLTISKQLNSSLTVDEGKAKIIGGLSLLLWFGVIISGRLIPYL